MDEIQRFNKLLKAKKTSVTDMAKMLGIAQSTLFLWLQSENDKKILAEFPRVLEIFPDVSREWLFFGDGEMLDTGPTKAELARENAELKAQLEEERTLRKEEQALNRRLVNRVLLSDADAKDTENAARWEAR